MDKLERLRAILKEIGQGVVAFSGGCDSAFLLKVAHQEMGGGVVALTAISPSMPSSEREEAARLAQEMGVRHVWVESQEMERSEFVENPPDRCFYCKDELFTLACRQAAQLGLGTVMDGNNRDDRNDHRPGRRAARLHNVRSPLDEAELTKVEIRHLAKQLGLSTWDKPAMACLASRFPYGTEITKERLSRIGTCEEILRALGFRQFRARFHEPVLRIEVAEEEIARLLDPQIRQQIVQRCKAEQFLYITLDLEGYRTGRLNEALAAAPFEKT